MTEKEAIKAIAPYTTDEVAAALKRLTQSERFIKGLQYFYPNWNKATIIKKLNNCASCADFQITFIEPIISHIIKDSTDGVAVVGLDNITKDDHFLYLSNHRDIFLDSALLQYELYHRQLPFTEISLGDNLMVDPLIETVAKLNNMFTVFRTGSRMELLRNAQHLSAYLRHSICNKKVSAWIAQGNGRTKNGIDKTFPGLIHMLLMSGGDDFKKSIADLKIMVATISYEYEPCAFEKAKALQTIADTGSYTKSKWEDIQSILKGIKDYKGRINMVFEPLDVDKIEFSSNKKISLKAIVNAIDQMMAKNYKLWKTNYMAYDLLHQTSIYQAYYKQEDLIAFEQKIQKIDDKSVLRDRVLRIYANALDI